MLGSAHLTDKNVKYIPSEDEIRLECEKIRENWNSHRLMDKPRVEIKVISTYPCDWATVDNLAKE